MKVVVTGAAGFIGAAAVKKLIQREDEVVGLDNLNDYYDVQLKKDRLADIGEHVNFRFHRLDIADRDAMQTFFKDVKPERVIHLAAQAGVRYSIENPYPYVDSNLTGFLNILEGCRHNNVEHLVFASSSSVYGTNTKMPFSVNDRTDAPVSLYGATKKSNELMAHSYSHLYKIPITGLRFFTVYGPWGRPDMAYFKFTEAIINDRPIDVYNNGDLSRDFTYINDIIDGVLCVLHNVPHGKKLKDTYGVNTTAPFCLYNIGNHSPVNLLDFIEIIESELGKKAKKRMLPMQPGDVHATYADINDLISDVGFSPSTPIEEGMKRFIEWYRHYYGTA